mmetsp:Transcript_29726/g.60750  ORF Transcript_29726/g.60750 Transcript_29726/m.60750 type:complete len:431 (-) Transcript_29726:296-1588(-)|eukprot:CAMPEP_0183309566 /NCGR_PEP_ID=MMETSP0160_2-20130417/25421_1 /TAXON_ID=2839 ORGANISM="Odontella Sinensis, Strain Grunow 1884" /NCGR_SAMPLE_ID=MMETSP0160_2 /ASSEMBLY_ACC=CAM_ASM_000250 /LENGTH=430 /DNA_ID=CAMNT_0025473619 /DNA_START=180 /DNA_END=1472 /DNA_ORIENTATION=-
MKTRKSTTFATAVSAAAACSLATHAGSCHTATAFVMPANASHRRQREGEGGTSGSRADRRVGASGCGALCPNRRAAVQRGQPPISREVHRDEEDGRFNNFALRMRIQEEEEEAVRREADRRYNDDDEGDYDDVHTEWRDDDDPQRLHDRRMFMSAMLATAAAPAFSQQPASALERSYPEELGFDGKDPSITLESIRGERIAAKRAEKKKTMDDLTSNPAAIRTKKDYLGSVVWAGALWLLAGSRSNPLVTPLANVLYDEEEEPWLKDRNEGLFSPLPPGFLFLMGLVFLCLGVFADRTILLLTEGDSNVTLQLAGVALIGGGSLELGRIASGEKADTRDDSERDEMLANEFQDFAERRLKPGGNCHRSEVVGAFRRFNAKYRVENDEYPLTDLEIERLLRSWNRAQGNEDMSSAGFFTGIQIDNKADAFR